VIGRRRGTVASVAFLCDRCNREVVQACGPGARPAACPGCGRTFPAPSFGDPGASTSLSRCLRCGLDRLYVQKDFSKKAGLWVFVVAALLSVPTWGLSLLAATLLDLGLYYALGEATLCYGCGAVHRGFGKNPRHAAFDIHTQEAVDRGARTA
jgi:hypothetical protein